VGSARVATVFPVSFPGLVGADTVDLATCAPAQADLAKDPVVWARYPPYEPSLALHAGLSLRFDE